MEFNTPTTAEYAEAFGVELPVEEPVTEVETPEVTEPQTEPTEKPATEPETEPAEDKKDVMPPEERAIWAARRRKWEAREQQEKEQQAIEAASQARVDKIYADIFKGQVNPYSGKEITTEAEYKAYIAERDRKNSEEQLQKAGIDPKTIQSMVDQQMAPLRQQMETAQLAAIQEKAKAANARFEAALNAELQKITAIDPSVKTLEDIRNMPTANRFNELVQKGIGLEEAFYLANRQAIEERRLAAARTAMQEQMAGKGHLNPVAGAGGKTPIQVPRGVVETYRAMFPDATDAEIQKAYESAYKS